MPNPSARGIVETMGKGGSQKSAVKITETQHDNGRKVGQDPHREEADVCNGGVVYGRRRGVCNHEHCRVERCLLGRHHQLRQLGEARCLGRAGGSAEKPVGLVWFGLASGGARSRATVITEKKIFPGDREDVRTAAIEHALTLLLGEIVRF